MAPMNGVGAMCAWVEAPGPWIVTQTFGPTSLVGEPMCNGSRTHRGIDLGVPAGNRTMLPRSLSGKFTVNTKDAASSGGYGNLVIVRDVPMGGDLYDVYLAHHSSFIVQNGAVVSPGTLLAVTGSTGFSTGPHVHFEVRPKGSGNTCSSIDPTNMMQDPSGSGNAQPTNITLLNGGLDLNPLDGIGKAITGAEQELTKTMVSFASGTVGLALIGGGTVATMFMLRGTKPDIAGVAARAKDLVTPAPQPPPKAAPQPRQRQYTPAEQSWNPRKLAPPTAEGIAGKMRTGKKLTPAEVMWGNANSDAVGKALGKMAP